MTAFEVSLRKVFFSILLEVSLLNESVTLSNSVPDIWILVCVFNGISNIENGAVFKWKWCRFQFYVSASSYLSFRNRHHFLLIYDWNYRDIKMKLKPFSSTFMMRFVKYSHKSDSGNRQRQHWVGVSGPERHHGPQRKRSGYISAHYRRFGRVSTINFHVTWAICLKTGFIHFFDRPAL